MIGGGVARHENWLSMLGDPPSNSLANLDPQATDIMRMVVLRRAQYQFLIFEQIDKAGVTLDYRGCEIDQLPQHRFQGQRSRHAPGNSPQQSDSRGLARDMPQIDSLNREGFVRRTPVRGCAHNLTSYAASLDRTIILRYG